MTVFEAFIQGLVQGFTEFLPISSSGHLSLLRQLFGFESEGSLFFSLLLHLGTLAAVFIAFGGTIWGLIREFFTLIKDISGGRFRFKAMSENRAMLVFVILASVPLIAVYFLKDYVEAFSSDNDIIIEGVCFLITAALLFAAARKKDGRKTSRAMKTGDAFIIGAAQAVAVMPGISRSGATVSAGILRGYSKEFMVTFSFIMGIPAILGASVSELPHLSETAFLENPLSLFVGFITAAGVGFLSIKILRWLVRKNSFVIFAWYLIALGSASVIFGIIK